MKNSAFYIGWDVGGWNCDKNSKSRDAIVILDGERRLVGEPWRGNLRESINRAQTGAEWVSELFGLCDVAMPGAGAPCVLAIDTPLGFSDAFVQLVSARRSVGALGDSHDNPYLFRETEQYLFRHGLRPLSPVKDMIGSQATKGMHVLARFAPKVERCGVWTDDRSLHAIEAYPSACKRSDLIAGLREGYPPLGHEDKEDALTCALVAYLFAKEPDLLEPPGANTSASEGWIWVPRDVLVAGDEPDWKGPSVAR